MEARFDLMLTGEYCGSIGILHEHHGADRGDGSAQTAFQNPVRSQRVSAPIISVYDKETRSRYVGVPACRLAGQRGFNR